MTTADVALALVSAINQHDVAAIRSCLAASHRLVDAAGAVVEGADPAATAWTAFFRLVPAYRIAVDRVLAEGDEAALLGTASGDGWHVPAAWRVRSVDDRVDLWQVFADPSPLRAAWTEEAPLAITVCDREGRVLEMNARSDATFARDGGRAALLGASLLDCHPGAARDKLAALLASPERNVYSIEKAGVRKLIYQCPWYAGGAPAGLVELSLPIPATFPHFVRGK
jgi:PAS domain-containing protein